MARAGGMPNRPRRIATNGAGGMTNRPRTIPTIGAGTHPANQQPARLSLGKTLHA